MDWIGTIGYKTEVDTSGVRTGTNRAEQAVRESMRRIDNMNATAHADLELKELELKIVEAKRQLVDLDRKQAEPEVALDDDAFKKQKADIEKDLKELSQRKLEIGTDL